ncbi:MAG: diacylglycerol kinase family protein [Candidatus Nomurabacteria bacterium]|nr:diacylglycerol kinase family protein [Candidatus Nomurabacteria bacterium]
MTTDKKLPERKRFSIVARLKSATHAWRGLGIFIKTTHNSWVQIFFGLIAIYLGYILCISSIEWIMVVFSIGLVLVTEALNTAFEIDIDLTSPNYHPYARDTKDVAAAAALISVAVSIIIGLIIFLPKIINNIH